MNIQTVTFNNLSFLNVHDLQELELKYLKQEFKFNHHDLDDFIQKRQVPKIEDLKEYSIIVLDFPYTKNPEEEAKKENPEKLPENKRNKTLHLPTPNFNSSNSQKNRVRAGHVTFFIGPSYVVVLHDKRTPLIDDIFAQCQATLRKREEYMGGGPSHLFYLIVDKLVDSSLSLISDLSRDIDQIDRHLLEGFNPEKIVEDISITRRNIVVFQRMVKPALSIFSELEKGGPQTFTHLISNPWGNTKDHLQRIWYRLEDNRELIEGIARSHESLLTAKTNEIVKVLTMFTAILLPLTLVASIYGMNIIGLPYSQQQNGILIISLIMLILALAMILVFKIRNWL